MLFTFSKELKNCKQQNIHTIKNTEIIFKKSKEILYINN